MCAALHVHVCCVVGRARVRTACEHSEPPSTVEFVGSQAFSGATAFNAAIGAWNTAGVFNMTAVCATFGRRRATAADALGLTD